MTQTQFFTTDMIQGNRITWTKKAEITTKGTTVTIQQYKDESAAVWITTATTSKKVAENLHVIEAINFANNLLINI
jgi:hypothetical protein